MSEQGGRDWVCMTPDDFDRDAPPRPEVDGRIPAELDECGTAPLFGDEPTPASTGAPTSRPVQRGYQARLF
ncbi:hypothetical protein OR263_24085 [Streptomyces sp. NEAU-H22]|uniref:hypothetical protein n=1 Tax=unclassified Streptomyces TaxID=2593676 RepID=UPI002256FAB7|nr:MULTISPECIES: hypothetical protein [unclassified Streptomyces]MCX3289751.1 hypothetical protein [Streptomyces sp. NEAU-H22]WMD06436.1 hypothetical protein Q7C01_19485 [Streptomyces sp. FXY-T5]